MIVIRLKRRSSKHNLTYSVVVTLSQYSAKSNKFLEKIGYYNPILDKWSNKYLFIDFDRLKFWVERGARVNGSLFVLLRAWFSLKYFSSLKVEKINGSKYFYLPKKRIE